MNRPEQKTEEQLREDARRIFDAALARVQPEACINLFCRREGDILHLGDTSWDLSGIERIYLIGAGKASAAMAAAVEPLIEDQVTVGMINVKYGHTAPLTHARLTEAGHPVPDENGVTGAREILRLAESAGEKDLIICLVSGGGSALTPLPAPGLTLADKQAVTRAMLACGATIHQINTLRKHLSDIKGGRLARAAAPAPVVSLMLSDVVGDNLDVIASGMTVPDASTFADCLAIIDRFGIADQLPAKVMDRFRAGAAGEIEETPKAGDPMFDKTYNRIIGSNSEAISAARAKAGELGYNTLVLSSMIEGETSQVAAVHGAIAREIVKSGNPIPTPACVLSGGETTVTITGPGKGGRNQEFTLAAALDIAGQERVVAFSGGTDGTDGPTDAAGAVADGLTVDRAAKKDLDPAAYLAANDSYHFFEQLGDLVKTGPTNTNVMDLRLMMVG